MENENNEKLIGAINAQTEVLNKFVTVLDAYMSNNNQMVSNLNGLNKFSSEVFTRINNMSLVLDALSVCLFEKKLISEKRFEEVIIQLREQYQQTTDDEHKCDGGCHEEKGKGDSSETESK